MAARTDPTEPNRAIIAAAAAWQAELADDACDDESRSSFDRWLRADPRHRIAFERMNAIAGQVARQSRVERTALELMLSKSRKRGGRMLLFLALVGSTTTLAWWGADQPAIRARLANARTAIGELQRRPLASGDSVVFDSDTAADIDNGGRTVRLWRGGVMASVAKGGTEAFLVRTPQGTARALGTQYSVRVNDGVTTVSVFESRVEACASAGNRSCLTLDPGQSARLDARGASRIADIDPAAEKAWSDGLLVADDRPLGEVIDRLNRYRPSPIHYARKDLEGIRVSGTFPLTDTNRALTSLRAALPIVVEDGPDGTTVKRR